MAKPSSLPSSPPVADSSPPVVRLEVRSGAARPTLYEVGDGGFLVGSVPGCDLRLPGANQPPVFCLITRHAAGASLRKLAPVQPIVVNSRTVTSVHLQSGDRIVLGAIEIGVQINGAARTVSPAATPDPESDLPLKQVAAREAKLRGKLEQAEVEREAWQARETTLQAEYDSQARALEEATSRLQRQEQDLLAVRSTLEAREQVWREAQQQVERLREQIGQRDEGTSKQADEVLAWQRELSALKQELLSRFRARKEKLTRQAQAVRRAAQTVQERKRATDADFIRINAMRQELDRRQTEVEAAREQFGRERRVVEDQHRLVAGRQQDLQREMAERLRDVEERERKIAEDRNALEQGQKQHQADLVRLDRVQAVVDQRHRQLHERAKDIDHKFEQMQRATRELEEQAVQMDAVRERLTNEQTGLEQRRKEMEEAAGKLDQRAAALESQQAMLATLRTRMERLRDELRRQEQELTDQRVAHETAESEQRQRVEQTTRLREEVEAEKLLFDQERQRFDERRTTLDQAVAQLRQAQEAQVAVETQLRQRQQEVDATAGEQANQAGLLLARGQQVDELHQRAAADRLALREREAALAKSEATLASLQEQLRRRGEELNQHERDLVEREKRVHDDANQHENVAREWEGQRKLSADGLDALRLELSNRAAQLDEQVRDLQRREELLRNERSRLDDDSRSMEGHRQVLQSERIAFEVEKQAASEIAARRRAEFEVARADVVEIGRQVPDLEARADTVLERLQHGREQLREHLADLHTYARQSRDDLDAVRKQLIAEVDRLRQQERDLHSARDQHRLAVAAFRQQMVEWQTNLAEVKQTLARGESRLDRREAEMAEKAQQAEVQRQELAQQAEVLEEAERAVEERRGEVNRHLLDMREWYRKKMREISGIDAPVDGEPDIVPLAFSGTSSPAVAGAAERGGILAVTGDVAPGDRQLGDLLRSAELIDAETLTALLLEARRQRRSLRQLLLGGKYLTLYQMAMIEAGNLDRLALGPVRVIDRLQTGARESVYRVFDPRRNQEAVLRHLAESEMLDAVRPDEFRQRFAAAATLRHAHLQATYEVLDIAGRPAVLQEWLAGVPSSEWPSLAAAPGVWYRLLSQAALALQTVHAGGLLHGRLLPASLVLTGEGILKLAGLGEPRWLSALGPTLEAEPTIAGDLAALGKIAASWAASVPGTKPSRSKALPVVLQEIVRRFASEDVAERFESAAALLDALEKAGSEVPANAAAWERFVKQVREQTDEVVLRRTA
jgi:chromosome segregation ATPase